MKIIVAATTASLVLFPFTTVLAHDTDKTAAAPTAEELKASPEGAIIPPDGGERLVRKWGYSFLLKIDEKTVGATQFVVGSEKLPPGKSVHVHRHKYAEELLIINSGTGTATLGDKREKVGPGDIVFIPQNGWAGLENTGDEVIDFLWLFPKPGIERYFRETSVPEGQEPKNLTEQELDEIRARNKNFVLYRDKVLKDYTKQND